MRSYVLVVNPVAGDGQGEARARRMANALGPDADVQIVLTSDRGAAAELAAERCRDVDRIVAVGGDGTLNEVLTGLVRAGTDAAATLAFLPSGTANAAARAFGLTTDPEEAGRLAKRAPEDELDVCMVRHEGGERPFLIRFGAGLDAAVIEELNASRADVLGLSGLVLSAPRIVQAMTRYPAPDIYIEADGRRLGTAASVVLPNVEEVGLQATVAEGADPADGYIDVLLVSLPSKLSIVTMGLRMLASSLSSAPEVEHVRARTVRLSSDGDAPFQLDGEPIGTLPVEVRVHPRAVRFLMTRAGLP